MKTKNNFFFQKFFDGRNLAAGLMETLPGEIRHFSFAPSSDDAKVPNLAIFTRGDKVTHYFVHV